MKRRSWTRCRSTKSRGCWSEVPLTRREPRTPFFRQPPHAWLGGERVHSFGREPAQFVALAAEDLHRVLWRREQVPDVVVKVRGLRPVRGNRVDIQIERLLENRTQVHDARFLQRLAASHAQDIFIAVAMSAKLQPAVDLAVMMQ